MELTRLEKYKNQFKDLSEKISSLQSFLGTLGVGRSNAILTPYVVSVKLHIPETDAFFLLSLAAREDIVHKKFQVWTEDHNLLGDFESTNSIPETLTDMQSGKEVDRDHFFVDVVFELEK